MRSTSRKPPASSNGTVELLGGGYFDGGFWGRQVAYPAYVAALVESGYTGFMNWEYCHPAKRDGKPVGIEYVHEQTQMALDYMKSLRALAQRPAMSAVASR
jgi:sugar phosphate isomerase/epimerase